MQLCTLRAGTSSGVPVHAWHGTDCVLPSDRASSVTTKSRARFLKVQVVGAVAGPWPWPWPGAAMFVKFFPFQPCLNLLCITSFE